VWLIPLTFNRQHLSCGDCLEDNIEDYQNLCAVSVHTAQKKTVINTLIKMLVCKGFVCLYVCTVFLTRVKLLSVIFVFVM